MLYLQNGSYDKPDRMFYCIESTWKSVLNAPTDLKELIPQFYDIDSNNISFLINQQHINFGYTQTGQSINDVILPAWAYNSPIQFIQIMRNALESDYISEHINEWIDLIFGINAHSNNAITNDNVFYYATYEKNRSPAAKIHNIQDSEYNKIYSNNNQINEFGVIPIQLFYENHPKRDDIINDDVILNKVVTPVVSPHISPNRSLPIAKPAHQQYNNNNTNGLSSTISSVANNTTHVVHNTTSWFKTKLFSSNGR